MLMDITCRHPRRGNGIMNPFSLWAAEDSEQLTQVALEGEEALEAPERSPCLWDGCSHSSR